MKYDENDHPVLTKAEYDATAQRDYYLDAGDSVTVAAEAALALMEGRKTAKFVDWLSQGHLALVKGEVTKTEATASA